VVAGCHSFGAARLDAHLVLRSATCRRTSYRCCVARVRDYSCRGVCRRGGAAVWAERDNGESAELSH
jgi:hypothetical protein